MRSEKEMFDLLISTAREDENILAAYLEGSRTVPGVPKDIFQDYDLVYVVKEILSVLSTNIWMKNVSLCFKSFFEILTSN